MLDEKKIRLMTDLARYENQHGKEELKISRYYRSDYLGLALFRNFDICDIFSPIFQSSEICAVI